MLTILSILQVAAALLQSLQQNPHADLALQQQALAAANQAVQLSTQLMASTSVSTSTGQAINMPPNIMEVENASYMNIDGTWAHDGAGIAIVASSTSFGDLNNDGHDDAAVLIERSTASGMKDFALAVLINQNNGTLINVANASLGNNPVAIYDHAIENGELVIDMQVGTQPRATYPYVFTGNTFKIQ